MVKNTVGGNRARGFARKNEKPQSNKLRLSDNEDEKYAHIIKMFGNGMCQALCEDNKTRTCIIRGKFRGKGKRNSFVTPGAIVLVGTREAWSSDNDKCDLLELYTSTEVEQLKHHPKVPTSFLSMELNPRINSSMDDINIDFSNTNNSEDEIQEYQQSKDRTVEEFVMDDSEIINIDDI
jgi:initiation factor 1A